MSEDKTTELCRWFWQRWFCQEPVTPNALDWACAACHRTPAPNLRNRPRLRGSEPLRERRL